MKLKIHFIVLNLLSSSIFSMEIEKATLLELIQNQKDVVAACKEIDPKNNKLLALSLRLSESCVNCILEIFNEEAVRVKIEALEDYLEKHSTYQATLADAQAVEDHLYDFDEAAANKKWNAWRNTSALLMREKLVQKKMAHQLPDNWSIPDLAKAHANMTEEQTQYLLAQFFVTMKLREKQRKLTKRYLSPLRIK